MLPVPHEGAVSDFAVGNLFGDMKGNVSSRL